MSQLARSSLLILSAAGAIRLHNAAAQSGCTKRSGTLTCSAAAKTERPVVVPSAIWESETRVARWDSACVANPVVLAPQAPGEDWLLFYYGNAGSWAGGEPCFLPTGRCGMATSADGITWKQVDGAAADGSIFAEGELDAWDGLHIGVGDVVRLANGTLVMFYLGGSNEAIQMGPASRAGLRMRIGRATSDDRGRSWRRSGAAPVLDYCASEGLFASWPRVLLPDGEDGAWLMTYHGAPTGPTPLDPP